MVAVTGQFDQLPDGAVEAVTGCRLRKEPAAPQVTKTGRPQDRSKGGKRAVARSVRASGVYDGVCLCRFESVEKVQYGVRIDTGHEKFWHGFPKIRDGDAQSA